MFIQHTTTFFLIVGVVTAMGVLVKRSVQSRIKAARDHALREVRMIHADPQYNIQGNLWSEYEPYYLETRTVRDVSQRIETTMRPDGKEGIISYELSEEENESSFHTRRTQLTAEHAD